MTIRPALAAQLAPAIEAKNSAAVNRMAVAAAFERYSDRDWYDTFLHVLRGASEDVWHFWMKEDCPCYGDPFFHER